MAERLLDGLHLATGAAGLRPVLGAPVSLRRLANERADICKVLRWLNYETPDSARTNKVHCPFGEIWHKDGGHEAAARIYEDSNVIFCFACSRVFVPTSLYALSKDCTETDAAEMILREFAPQLLLVNEITEKIEFMDEPLKPDIHSLRAALDIYCSRIDENWNFHQFEKTISGAYLKCLNLLGRVVTTGDADLWLAKSKEIMKKVIKES